MVLPAVAGGGGIDRAGAGAGAEATVGAGGRGAGVGVVAAGTAVEGGVVEVAARGAETGTGAG